MIIGLSVLGYILVGIVVVAAFLRFGIYEYDSDVNTDESVIALSLLVAWPVFLLTVIAMTSLYIPMFIAYKLAGKTWPY